MTPQKQRFRHRPEVGEYGDCHRTAIACLLDLDRDSVPNFGEHYDDTKAFFDAVDAFLREHGFATVDVAFKAPLDDLLAYQATVNPHAYYMLAGMSNRGLNHTVVACGGEIAWDPHPDGTALVGPCDDGYYWSTYIVPRSLVREAVVERDEPVEAA